MAKTLTVQDVTSQLKGSKGRILVEAKQDGRFLKKLDQQLQKGLGVRTQKIAQNSADALVRGIKHHLSRGIKGARGTITKKQVYDHNANGGSDALAPVSVKMGLNGKYIRRIEYRTTFPQLSPTTIWRKQQHPGRGRFWKDYAHSGDSRGRPGLTEIAAGMKSPKVTARIKTNSLEARRANQKDPYKVDFVVSLGFGNMDFPFDQLVRRPLISGKVSDDPPEARGGKEDVFIHLEFGATTDNFGHDLSEIPARPWIRGLSANVGTQMLNVIKFQ